jgi:hypothetical protein
MIKQTTPSFPVQVIVALATPVPIPFAPTILPGIVASCAELYTAIYGDDTVICSLLLLVQKADDNSFVKATDELVDTVTVCMLEVLESFTADLSMQGVLVQPPVNS